jgi:hypothetical protein
MTEEQKKELGLISANLWATYAFDSYKIPVVTMMKIVHYMKENDLYLEWVVDAYHKTEKEYKQ